MSRADRTEPNCTCKQDQTSPNAESGKHARIHPQTNVMIYADPSEEGIFAKITDWSPVGVRLLLTTDRKLPSLLYFRQINAFALGPLTRCERIWQTGKDVGVRFT